MRGGWLPLGNVWLAPVLALPSKHVLQVSSHQGRETTLCMCQEKHKE